MLSVEPDRLVIPREDHAGRVVWQTHEAEISHRLRFGDPALGWEGDPELKLVRRLATDDEPARWEVWRTAPDGTDTLVTTRGGDRFPGNDLIVALVRADSRRHDRLAQIMASQEAQRRRVEADRKAENLDRADKLAWALGKDLGMPAQSGRPFTLGGSQ